MNVPGREETIFAEALRLPQEERAAYVARETGGNSALHEEVESLLRSYGAGDFLEQAAAPELRPTPHLIVPVTEKPGDTIGRYKLLQQIGEGGCGVVYMAEQTEPVRRRVALKIIKLGMDTRSVIARFEAERQALAMMDHPNIAKVLDAGATDTGRPYFVMELVRGMKITDYCDEKKLPMRERLDLFIQVCHAIQHAHQKGIIHRDIKPSNILVSLNDGVTVPKVIDFGIAKATTGQQLTDKTLFTAFEQFIGTPAYMSPEQAMITNMDVDTRSDIYALGVLLYEMLTGKTPFDAQELLAIGLDEMRRTIREQEPPRPSTRLSTLPGQELSTTAQRRGLEAPKLVSELRGDLDWIVMKALEKDRARRYETANGLAMDIQRHLNHQPVLACPPGNLYRLQKLVRRNKLAFAAGASVAAALVLGLGVATWMFFRERTARQEQVQLRQAAQAAQRNEATLRLEADTARTTEARLRLQAQAGEKKAEAEAARSEQVAQFLKDMLQSIRPSVALGRDTTLVREIVDQTAERVGKDLADQPSVQAELQGTIAEVYQALGKSEQAEMNQRKALAAQRASLGDEHPEVARALNDLALILWREGDGVGVERWRDEAVSMGNVGVLNDYHSPDSSSDAGSAGGWLIEEVEQLNRDALAIRRKALGNENLETTESLNNLALVLRRQGKLEEAGTLHREALDTRKKILAGDALPIAASLHNLAVVLRDRGRLPEAKLMFQEALAMRRKLPGTPRVDVARTVHNLADVLQRQSDLSGIKALLRDELTNAISLSPIDQILDVLFAHEQHAQLDQLLGELITPAIQKEPGNVALLRNRAQLLARRGRWHEAAVDLARVIELDPETHDPWYALAFVLLQNGEIEAYRKHCHAMLLRFGGVNQPFVAERTAKACLLLPVSGSDLVLATELAHAAVLAGRDHPFLPYYQFAKGLAEYRLGQYAQAEDWLRKSLALDRGNLGIPARLVLAMSCHRLGKTNHARYAFVDALPRAEESFLNPATSDYGEHWSDVLICQTLFEEAKALIGSDALTDRYNVNTRSKAFSLYREAQPSAEAALRDVVANYKALLGPEHPLLIAPLHCLGHTLERQQDWREAEAIFRERLALSETHDQNHGSFDALKDLASVLTEQKKLTEVEAMLREALAVRIKLLGNDHPRVAWSLNALGVALFDQGKLAEAEAMFREAFILAKRLVGDEHPDVANSLNNLAFALGRQGKLAEAETMHREALALQRKLHGDEHPDTLARMNSLGLAYLDSRKFDKATTLFEEAFSQRKAKLGPEHPDTLTSMHNLGFAYRRSGKSDKAVPLLEEAFSQRKAKLGPEHPDTLASMNSLGLAYLGSGKSDKAVPLLEEAFSLSKAKLGPENPDTLTIMHNLGLAFRDAGQRDKALPLFGQVFELSKAKLGSQHTSTLGCMRSLAVEYRDSGQLDHALPLFQELLKLNTAVRGPNDPETRLTTEGLVKTLRKAGKLEQAEAMLREQLAEQTGDVSAAKIGLGTLLLEAAKTNSTGSRRPEDLVREGEQLMREYLAEMRSRYTNDPLKLAARLYDAAEPFHRHGNYAEAEPLYRQILECRRSRLSADHKDVIEPAASLARTLSDWAWAERAKTVATDVRRLTSSSAEPSTSTPRKTDQSPATTSYERAHEAEKLLREVLAVRLRDSDNSWRIGDVKSRLGAALVSVAVTDPGLDTDGREAKLREAESLLVEGCERVQSGATDDKYKHDALQRLVRLYEALEKPDKRAEWQQKLDLLDKPQEKPPASEPLIQDTPAINAETK